MKRQIISNLLRWHFIGQRFWVLLTCFSIAGCTRYFELYRWAMDLFNIDVLGGLFSEESCPHPKSLLLHHLHPFSICLLFKLLKSLRTLTMIPSLFFICSLILWICFRTFIDGAPNHPREWWNSNIQLPNNVNCFLLFYSSCKHGKTCFNKKKKMQCYL